MNRVFDGLEAAGYIFERPVLNTEPEPRGILDILVNELNANAAEDEHWERLHHEPAIIDERGREHELDGAFAPVTYEPADDLQERALIRELRLGNGENGMSAKVERKSDIIKTQCRLVGLTGRTNMFDAKSAFEIALEMNFHELARP